MNHRYAFLLKLAGALLLVVLADLLFWFQRAGSTLGLFALAVLIVTGCMRMEIFRRWPSRIAFAGALFFALALAAARADDDAGRRQAGQAVLDSEADRAQLATALHDRVAHDLVALQYTAELVRDGKAAPGDLREPVRTALTAYRQAQRDLRAHALEGGLRAALAELARRVAADRPDDGQRPLKVTIRADDAQLDELPPPIAVTVERVAEALLRGAAGRASVFAEVDGQTVKLRVDSADIACDASELDRWNRRVSALGGILESDPHGVELTLPAATEGSHDDGPDL